MSLSVAVISLQRVKRERLTNAQARRVALAAQGFGVPRPDRAITIRDVQAMINRLGQFQIDSINVVTRAQFMPLFSRLGPYDTAPARASRAPAAPPAVRVLGARREPDRRHPAAAAPVPDAGRLPRRLGRGGAGRPGEPRIWSSSSASEVAARGPISARQLEVEEERDRSNWGWNWSGGQDRPGVAVLLRRGRLGLSQLPVRAGLRPARTGAAAAPCWPYRPRRPRSPCVGLVRRAAQALGVASEFCLRDYFRTRPAMTREAIATLVESGELHSGHRAGLGRTALLPVASGPAAAPDRGPGAAQPVRLDDLRAEPAGAAVRLRTTGSRSTSRSRSGSTATTSIRSCWTTRSSPGSTSRPTGPRGVLRVNSAWLEPGQDPRYVAGELATELS